MTPSLTTLLRDVQAGHRLTPDEGEFLMKTTGRDVFRVTAAADEVREKKVGDIVTYVRNQNLHVTNICKNLCGFCGFGKKATDPGAYCLELDAIRAGVRQAQERRVTEICFLSGVNPAFDLDSYTDLIAAVHEIAPEIHVHAFSPDEVAHAAKRSKLTTAEVLAALRDAGLGSLQGTAAEILIESVRKVICPRKVSGTEWARIIKEAHAMGIRTSSTIMYGSYESARDQVDHMDIIRQIQDETHGFTEFIPMSYIHTNTPLFTQGIARAGQPAGGPPYDCRLPPLPGQFQQCAGLVGQTRAQDDSARAPLRGKRPCRHHVYRRGLCGCGGRRCQLP